jgi:splicing factor 3A subunit 1
MEMETEEEVQKPPSEIKVRKDYVKGSRAPEAVVAVQYSKCPKCGQDIPVDELAEHMRIELLDPRFREQRQQQEREKARTAATSIGQDDEISRNLAAFARRRTDIFGDDEEVEIGKTVNPADAEKEYKQKDEDQIWDGHTGSIPRTTNSVAAAAAAAAAAIHAAKLAAAAPSRYVLATATTN